MPTGLTRVHHNISIIPYVYASPVPPDLPGLANGIRAWHLRSRARLARRPGGAQGGLLPRFRQPGNPVRVAICPN